MAQRTIHLYFGQQMAKAIAPRDENRFLLGNLLPDAYVSREERRVTHYIVRMPGQQRSFFDFSRFREDFREEILRDDLYLGYYLHLVEDACYRIFLHHKLNFWPQIQSMADVERLHRDYHLLNTYLVKTYGVRNTLTLPEHFADEPIHRLAHFDLESFLREMEGDFHETLEGETTLLTTEILDRFLAESLPFLLQEQARMRAGDWSTRGEDYSWVRETDNPLLA